MANRRPHRTAAEWSTIIERWRASGLTARAFAEEAGVAVASLYLWRKQLGSGVKQADSTAISLKPSAAFSEIRVASTPSQSGRIEILARNGRVVRVDGDVSAQTLRNVLMAVEQC
jgi:hypothetical protein